MFVVCPEFFPYQPKSIH